MQFRNAVNVLLLLCCCLFVNTVPAEDASFSKAVTEFSVKLLKELSKAPGENVLFSPSSIDVVLSLLQQGAEGSTAEQLRTLLHKDSSLSRMGFKEYVHSLAEEKQDGVALDVTSKIYLKEDAEVLPEYKSIVVEDFKSEIENLDFTNPQSVVDINKWVDEKTNGRIQNLIPPGALTSDTMMVLLSTVFFKGKWEFPFSHSKDTSKFHTQPNVTVEIPFMLKHKRLAAGKDNKLGYKYVELPYQGGLYSMVVMLPTANRSLEELIETLSSSDLLRILESKSTRFVKLKLPKFSLDVKTSLIEPLSQIGLTDIFSDGSNLTGITKVPIKVSNVLHQATLEVNEDGSEASAAAGAFVTTLSLPVYQDQLKFTADRPFLAIIFDRVRKIPLFISKIVNPS